MAHPRGFEPLIPGFVDRCLIQFGHGCLAASTAGRIIWKNAVVLKVFHPSCGNLMAQSHRQPQSLHGTLVEDLKEIP